MKFFKSENLIIFLVTFALAAAAGYYFSSSLKLIFGDALVRSFHAYLVFSGNEPKLSAIGFVWPPLQTLLQLPLVLITPLNTNGYAGNVLSAIFLGLTTIYLNLLGNFFKVNRILKYIILLLFVTNPFIFFYGSNGMSEMVGICFILMTLYYFLKHVSTHSIPALMLAGISLACSIMTRWETGMLLGVLLGVTLLMPFLKKKYSFRDVESSIVMVVIPVAFVIMIWLVASWLIVGSPTYFLKSTYSFTAKDAQNLAANTVVSGAKHSIAGTLQFVSERVIPLSAVFVPFLLLVLSKFVKRENRLTVLTILGFAVSVVISQAMPLYFGKSYGQLRYFIYVIPVGTVMALFLLKDTLKVTFRSYFAMAIFSAAVALMLTSSVLTFNVMSEYGNSEEASVVNMLTGKKAFSNPVYEHEEVIAKYIVDNISPRSILMDDSLGFNIVYLTKKPTSFIETVDSDFQKTLDDPFHSSVEYMLITDPETASGVDTVSLKYPQMFRHGTDFATLEKDFGPWRLYKLHDPKDPPVVAATPAVVTTAAVNIVEPLPSSRPVQNSQPLSSSSSCEHIVENGESLWDISSQYLGDGRGYEKILDLNPEITNPAKIYPAWKLNIPCPENA